MNDKIMTKIAVSVSEMASMCGLSRQRFHQLMTAGVFPAPLYDVSTRRPFFDQLMQETCLIVRKRNMGVNGQAVLFYTQRNVRGTAVPKRRSSKQHAELIESLKALGLQGIVPSQVEATIKQVFPQGIAGVDQAEVIRRVFLHLQRKDSPVNVAR